MSSDSDRTGSTATKRKLHSLRDAGIGSSGDDDVRSKRRRRRLRRKIESSSGSSVSEHEDDKDSERNGGAFIPPEAEEVEDDDNDENKSTFDDHDERNSRCRPVLFSRRWYVGALNGFENMPAQPFGHLIRIHHNAKANTCMQAVMPMFVTSIKSHRVNNKGIEEVLLT
jgi:hypothetical protein